MTTRNNDGFAGAVAAILIVIVLGAAACLGGCGVNERAAKTTLEAQGMTNVEIGGYPLWGCDEGDTFKSKFTATGASGQPVSGVLCSGFLKGITVRFD
jgi:hypothetical protein